MAQHALPDRLKRLEAVAGGGGMAADALAGAVVDGDEDPGPALGRGDGLGHVGAPHHVHRRGGEDRKSTRLNSSHANISYAVFCLKKKTRDISRTSLILRAPFSLLEYLHL